MPDDAAKAAAKAPADRRLIVSSWSWDLEVHLPDVADGTPLADLFAAVTETLDECRPLLAELLGQAAAELANRGPGKKAAG